MTLDFLISFPSPSECWNYRHAPSQTTFSALNPGLPEGLGKHSYQIGISPALGVYFYISLNRKGWCFYLKIVELNESHWLWFYCVLGMVESVSRSILGETVGVCAWWCHSSSLMGPWYMLLCRQDVLWVIHQTMTQHWGGQETQRLLCYVRGLLRWTLYTKFLHPRSLPCRVSTLFICGALPLCLASWFPPAPAHSLWVSAAQNENIKPNKELESCRGFCAFLSEWPLLGPSLPHI